MVISTLGKSFLKPGPIFLFTLSSSDSISLRRTEEAAITQYLLASYVFSIASMYFDVSDVSVDSDALDVSTFLNVAINCSRTFLSTSALTNFVVLSLMSSKIGAYQRHIDKVLSIIYC